MTDTERLDKLSRVLDYYLRLSRGVTGLDTGESDFSLEKSTGLVIGSCWANRTPTSLREAIDACPELDETDNEQTRVQRERCLEGHTRVRTRASSWKPGRKKN